MQSDSYGTITMIYDAARQEEKMLIREFSNQGRPVKAMKIDDVEIRLDKPIIGSELAMVRNVSHHKAILVAKLLNIGGVTTINGGQGMELAWNKALTMAMLGNRGLPVTPSLLVLGERSKAAWGYPTMLKPAEGSWGRMASMVRNEEELGLLLKHRLIMEPSLRPALLQPFIGDGTDYRIFVIGSQAVAGMVRKPAAGEWRSNVAKGGEAKGIKVDGEMEELAVKATEALGLEYAGVDLLFGDGFMINEVNAVPEFKGLIKATGVDIPRLLVRHVVELASR